MPIPSCLILSRDILAPRHSSADMYPFRLAFVPPDNRLFAYHEASISGRARLDGIPHTCQGIKNTHAIFYARSSAFRSSQEPASTERDLGTFLPSRGTPLFQVPCRSTHPPLQLPRVLGATTSGKLRSLSIFAPIPILIQPPPSP